MKCRHCGAGLELVLVDLGSAPPSNAYLTADQLRAPETWWPLRVLVCETCWLAQTEDFLEADQLFNRDYAYFSSYSPSWLAHSERYVADMVARFGLGADSHVIEVAANDGYLLQFVKARGIPCTGIEPTASTAAAARRRGIEIVESFFGVELADQLVKDGKQADLMVANNVLAHVPDINDFTHGFATLLKPGGVATFEFHHLKRLVNGCQFDTIYHEHFSYLSLTAVEAVFADAGLAIFDVEELPTHGGSLRVYAQRADAARHDRTPPVDALLEAEAAAGIRTAGYYAGFQGRVEEVKDEFLAFLLKAKGDGRTVGAYGAAAKGNTLLNFAGVRSDLVPFVVDQSPAKQGTYLPGSRIPVVDEQKLRSSRPQYVLVLPWNLREEIGKQLEYVRAWGGQLVTAVPRLEVG